MDTPPIDAATEKRHAPRKKIDDILDRCRERVYIDLTLHSAAMKGQAPMTSHRITIEYVYESDLDRSSVRVRYGKQVTETPWMIGDVAKHACRDAAKVFAARYPEIPQSHLGFIAYY